MLRKRNLLLAAAASAVLMVASIAGVAAQQGGGPDSDAGDAGPGRCDEFVARLATNLGVGEAELRAALQLTATQAIDEGVAAGRIPEAKAAEMKARIAAGDAGRLCGGRHRPDGDRGPGRGLARYILAEVAEAIGIEPPQLREELQDSTPAEVAAAHGVDRATLKATLVAHVTEHLDQLVAGGKLTEERRAELLAKLDERIEQFLDSTPGEHHGGPGGAGQT